jgi:hypothetical protein
VVKYSEKMSFLAYKTIPVIVAGLICLSYAGKSYFKTENEENLLSYPAYISEAGNTRGYRDAVVYNEKFVAIGTDGRIDCIDRSGARIPLNSSCRYNLNCVISNDQVLIVAGDNGTILYSSDGQIFSGAESGTTRNINGIAEKNGLIVAGADNGTILISLNGRSWNIVHTEAKGNILSLSANDSFFFGISETGEILRSNDGLNWVIKDYNKEYSGYNKSCFFKKILAINNRIAITGIHEDGSPSVLFSTLGNVWTERSLIYNDDQGMIRYLTSSPNDITYDKTRDQFILACDNGEIFSLPSCTKCNAYAKISTENLNAAACTEDYLLIVGEEFSVSVVKL